MRLKQERMAAKRDTFRQIDLSAATRDADEQYRWLREKRKPKKERKRREPESLQPVHIDCCSCPSYDGVGGSASPKTPPKGARYATCSNHHPATRPDSASIART